MLESMHSLIAFTLQGYSLSPSEKEDLVRVAEGRRSADRVISSFIASYGLDTECSGEGDNLYGIADEALLGKTMAYFSALRMCEVFRRPSEPPFDFDVLCDLHGEIFGDILPDAGYLRREEEPPYCRPANILAEGNALVRGFQYAKYFVHGQENLPVLIGDFAALRPFRRGSQAAVHLYLAQVCRWAGWEISWEEMDRKELEKAEEEAVFAGDSALGRVLRVRPRSGRGPTGRRSL